MNTNPPPFDEVRQLIEQATSILITNHVNPDGDAVGSALCLAGVLRKRGKQVLVSYAHPMTLIF
ncbi:MAG: hypothetical protein U5L96_04220 [Owenweeksia sp.]|nr:hypothetical protein [Owenweeksia sp.]